MLLNFRLNFLRKFENIHSTSALLTIYKCFIRTHLDYSSIIYDQCFNNSFQYNTALAITDTIRGTSRETIYQEIGLESLQQRRWYRKLCLFLKICLKYLFGIIPQSNCQYGTRNAQNTSHINVKHQFFKKPCFPSTMIEWNKLNFNIRNSKKLNIFKSKILKFIRLTANSIFGCQNPIGVNLLTRVRLSHLREHKCTQFTMQLRKRSRNYFSFSPFMSQLVSERLTLLSKIRNINPNILENINSQIAQFFLYGEKNFTASTNFIILSSTIEYILATKSFDEPLFL